MSRAVLVLVAAATFASLAFAQGPPPNGPRTVEPGWFALTSARLVTAPGAAPVTGTIVVRDGRITAVGDAPPPAGATVLDASGLTIYPGLVEPFYGSDVPALDPSTDDKHWNPMVQPQRRARDGALVPAADRDALRKLGYTTVACAPSGGILKGTAAVALLDEPDAQRPTRILREDAYLVVSLQTSRDGYPESEMGAVALLKQTLHDGVWYGRCLAAIAADPSLRASAPTPSAALQALVDHRALPLFCDSQDELQALRLLKVAAEYERKAVVVGSGMEFRRTAALAAAKATLVLPLVVPDAPDVATVSAAERVSLRQLQSWEQAPTNSKRMLDAGLEVAWTTARLRDRKDFAARARDAMACGVTADQALAAVTTVPAALLGVGDLVGTLAPGKYANLLVTNGDLFAAKTEVKEVWVGGRRHVVTPPADQGLDGTWSWTEGWPGAAGTAPSVRIAGTTVTVKVGDAELKVADVSRDERSLQCRVRGEALGQDVAFWLRLRRDGDGLVGSLQAPEQAPRAVRGVRTAAPAKDEGKETAKADDGKPDEKTAEKGGDKAGEKKDDKQDGKKADEPAFTPPDLGPLPTPLGGYGFAAMPEPKEFALVGATLWTSDGRGNLRDGAVHVRGGKIVFAGPRSEMAKLPADVPVIDATGKHVTPGMIDCHSHTGIRRGVNEGGQAVTAEVRIEDVLDPDDADWYRQLAGGVTMVNQLHGSANAIGGQSRTTKVRWGVAVPDDMHLAGARPGMKWALGENPRGANGGSGSRYPNTRMGVEALLRDRFLAADTYRQQHAAYEALAPAQRAKVLPPRRDLELEAIAELLAGVRWIHCHSYRQDEILMLCNLVRERGIKVGTFQHVLEGYKVADEIAQNAVGASSFTDWWAYKFEVYDAVPGNGALLHAAGAVVSFNSDSDELARRLNTEAGKAVKYGGLAPWDALTFVTRNPAIQLGVFERTGSLTAGKDADLVLWSDDPLSYAARCEATWVDGRPLFTLAADAEARTRIAAERKRLIQKALDGGKAGGRGRTARERDPKDAYWAAEDLTGSYCCRDAGAR